MSGAHRRPTTLAAALAALLVLVASTAAAASAPQTETVPRSGSTEAVPGPWVVEGDAVVRWVTGGAEGGAAAPAAPSATSALTGAGYATFPGVVGNRGRYVIRLVSSSAGNVEVLRSAAQQAAAEITATTGTPVSVAGGQVGWSHAPSEGEILVRVSSSSPCPAPWAGCGGPTIFGYRDGGYAMHGETWIHPMALGYSAHNRTHVVIHEIGHALGLQHWDGVYGGQHQVMHSSAYDHASFQTGDRNGIRDLHRAGNPFGYLDSVTSPAAGHIRVRGWAIDPNTTAATSVRVSVGSTSTTHIANSTRTDVAAVHPWAGPSHGYDIVRQVPAGTHQVCVHALTYGPGNDIGQGCRTVTVAAVPRPGAVTAASGTPGDGAVTLTWQPPTSGGPVADYQITQWPEGVVVTLPSTTRSYTWRPLVNGVGYTFAVTARNQSGPGPDTMVGPITPFVRPTNDAFSAAFRVDGAGAPITLAGTNRFATMEVGEPQHARPGGASVWWEWTPSVTSEVVLGTEGSDFDTTLAVYTGDRVDRLTPVAENDDRPSGGLTSEVRFVAARGVTYRIAVDGFGGVTGSIVLGLDANSVAGRYTPLPPTRVVDTRTGAGGWHGRLEQSETRVAQLTGVAGVPRSGVAAVVVNLTAVNASAPTQLTLWPTGPDRPTSVDLHVRPGDAIANLVTVAVDPTGRVSVAAAGGSTDVIMDVAGYYSVSGGAFVLLDPSRLVDSRRGTGGWTAPLGPGATGTLTVAGRGGVPANGVTAVALNVTAVAPTHGTHLTVWPDGSAQPHASSLNLPGGVTRANLVVVRPGSDGRVAIRNQSGATHVVVDVVGFWTAGAGALFVPLTAAPVVDTSELVGERTWPWVAGETASVAVAGRGGVPAAGAQAVAVTATGVAATADTHLSVWPGGTPGPFTSVVNLERGGTAVNLTLVPVGAGGDVSVSNNSGTVDVRIDVRGWFA